MQSYDQWRNEHSVEVDKKAKTAQLRVAHRAALQAKHLTSNETWDIFLSYLQSGREACDTALDTYKESLLSPNMVDVPEMMRIKMKISEFEAQIRVLDWVMGLPKEIIATGEIAEELLKDAEE